MAKRAATKSKEASERDDGDAAPPLPTLTPGRVTRFDQIIGHQQAIARLQQAIASGRVHHAWIFAGPSGVGKLATAVAFGATLLDPTSEADLSGRVNPDPESPVQQMVRAGTHPDLHIITKELASVSRDENVRKSKQQNIAAEVVREFLTEKAVIRRSVSNASPIGKVFIVDDAELLNITSQNALLKTIEEPPEGTVVILVTSSEDRLLPTIRSRCQRIDFSSLTDAELREWLKKSCPAGHGVDQRALSWALRFAQGSPGLLALAIDCSLFAWHEALEPMLVQADKGVYSPYLGGAMHKLVDEQAAAWVKRRPNASKDAANKMWARRMLAFLSERARLQLRAHAEKGGSDAAGIDRALHMLSVTEEAGKMLAENASQSLVFENLAAQLIAQPVVQY